MAIFDGKTILLTGGTGSFGNKFTEIVLREYNPEVIRIFSRGEKKQLDMRNKFNDDRLRFFIGDVRDERRLSRAMNNVDIVVHAAALKQVPACEYNPIEAVRTNIDGAVNVIDAAIDNSVEKVMAISTDKAVHPVNLYGGTKMVAEKLFIQGNSYTGKGKTRFSCVRYGNVIGSRGSVIPLFKEQKKAGTITITDERMTRFWITLDQGVRFVINCIEHMRGGEIFIPKIPSMKVVDLAEAIAPDAEKKIIGVRPGEKLHEIMCPADDSHLTLEFEDHYVIQPTIQFISKSDYTLNKLGERGTKVQQGFEYNSGNNTDWISNTVLLEMLKKV